MSNTGEFYDHTTFPVTRSTGSSANMRAELDLIEAGFNKLPPMTGNALRLVKVGSAATDLTVSGLYETTSNQLLYGTSASRTVYGAGRGLQLEASGPQASMSLFRNSADSAAPLVALGKSRGTTAGSSTIVQNGDALGAIVFVGADGTDAETPGAVIQAEVDGTPGANDLPTRLVFSTTADGAASVTERMRINSAGAVSIGSGAVLGSERLRVAGGDIQIDNAAYLKGRNAASTVTRLFGLNASDVLYVGSIDAAHVNTVFVNNGAIQATLTAAGNLGIGMTPVHRLDVTHSQNAASSIKLLNADAGTGADARLVATNGASEIGLIMRGTGFTGAAGQGLLYVTGANPLVFSTNGAERARIDSTGDLIIGGTTNTASSRLCVIAAEGEGQPASVNGDDVRLIRNSAAGSVASVSVIAGTAGVARYQLGDATAANRGVLAFNNSTGELYLAQSGTTRLSIDSAGLITVASGGVLALPAGAAATPSLTPTGDANTGLWFPATDTVAISTGGTEKLRIDSAGILVRGATTAATAAGGITPGIQNLAGVGAQIMVGRYSVDASGPQFIAAKSRSATVGSQGLVSSGDLLGGLSFQGSDGAAMQEAAYVRGLVDGTAALNDMPGRLSFATSPAGSATPVERLRITSAGDVTSMSSGAAVGYGAGAGGTVTQLTSKSTGVTLNRPSGQITMNGAALAASTAVGFTLTNSVIGTTDVVLVSIDSGATADAYHAQVDAVGAGSCRISIRNMTAGSLSEAVVLNFVVLRAATA